MIDRGLLESFGLKKMKWVDDFEREFKIKYSDKESYNIIIGEAPYKQKLIKDFKAQYNYAKPEIYRSIGHVAFFVTDWIKIQDSLEMIFNILTGDSNSSIKMLCHLRNNNVPTDEFALYLYEKCKIIFVNRYSSKNKKEFEGDARENICNYLKDKTGNVLFIGKNSSFEISNRWNHAKCLHPSGTNLNNYSEKYFRTFYKFDSASYEKIFKTENFDISNFKILV